MNTLISIAELAALLEQSEPLVIDCRKELSAPESGRMAYTAAHIPGAFYADLDTDLSDLSRQGLGRHPLPDEERFSTALARWGWFPGRPVVAYDDAGGALAAARLWWMLRLVGAREIRVLDGGYSAWLRAGLTLDSICPMPVARPVTVSFDQTQLVGYEALQAGLADASMQLIDARGAARYRGEVELLDRVAGHIPGARNRPFSDNLDSNGLFKSSAQLAVEFGQVIGAHRPDSVIHMCGSGVTACHNLLAMEHAGLHGSRLFAPSWSGWLSDPERPVSTGAEP